MVIVGGVSQVIPDFHHLAGRHIVPLLVLASCVFILSALMLPDYRFSVTISNSPKMFQNTSTGNLATGEAEECSDSQWMSVGQRRRLAATVVDVYTKIKRLSAKAATVDAKWSLKLEGVATELNPEINLPTSSLPKPSADSSQDVNVTLTRKTTNPLSPEEDSYRQDTFYGQFTSQCIACELGLTVVLPAITWTDGTANFVAGEIRKYYNNIPIIAIVSSEETSNKMLNITVIKAKPTSEEANLINEAVQSVRTPYIFIGSALSHFNNQSSLERLVKVLNEFEYVAVAGGSARNLQGRWLHGCLQQRMANYEAFYTLGYYHSRSGCMYCDDLLTPFVASTKLMTKISFTVGFRGNTMYHDWFAKIRSNGLLTVSCPDVMFYVTGHKDLTREEWVKLSKRWVLERVNSYDGKSYRFSCDSVGISCKGPLQIIRSYLLPHCCVEMMEKYVPYLTDYGNSNKLDHAFHSGSIIGAIKMGRYLPWDFDFDIFFDCKDYEKWRAIEKTLIKKKCHSSVSVKGIYITVNCPNFFLELYCRHYNPTHISLPEEYRGIPTTITYSSDYQAKVMDNPSLYTRNKVGFDYLKHVAHWRTVKGASSQPGNWNSCQDPKNHSCLDQFPGDGNLPFLRPFLQL